MARACSRAGGDRERDDDDPVEPHIPEGFVEAPWRAGQSLGGRQIMLWRGPHDWTFGKVSTRTLEQRYRSRYTHDVWVEGMPPKQFMGADLSARNHGEGTWVLLKKM